MTSIHQLILKLRFRCFNAILLLALLCHSTVVVAQVAAPTPTNGHARGRKLTVEGFQRRMAYRPIPSTTRIPANVVVTVRYVLNGNYLQREGEESMENFKQAVQNVIFDDMYRSGLFIRVDAEATHSDIDLLVNIDVQGEKPDWGTISMTVLDPTTKETLKAYRDDVTRKFRNSMEDLKEKLITDFKDMDFAQRRKVAEEARQKALAEEEQKRKVAEEARQAEISRKTDQDDSGKELFKLQPDAQFSVTQVTGFLITWKNRHLDTVLRNAKTPELRDYVDQIEHTIFEATDASEKEKDEAQRLIAAGTNDEHEHIDLARAYRLRIEVLKPILASIKEEVANRAK